MNKPRFPFANSDLREFSKHGPAWKLSVVVVKTLPAIFASLGMLVWALYCIAMLWK